MRSSGPVLIAGGGTAGHILPGLSIAAALVDAGLPRERLRWIGSERGQESSLVPPSGIDLVLLPGRGIQRRLAVENVGAVVGLLIAAVRAFWIFGRRRPAVVVSLGGYASVAASIAAVIWRVPLVLAEQNSVAGAANRRLGRFARAAAVPFDDTGLPRATVTGKPVRDEILALRAADPESLGRSRAAARRQLGMPPDRTVIAVFAGSLGSRRINEAIAGVVVRWDGRSDLHVHHVVGRRDWATFVRPRAADAGDAAEGSSISYVDIEYEERMDLLLAAADVAVCRSGGTTVAELAVVGLPAVLVPLPIAPNDHQRANAAALLAADAAVLLDDAACTPDGLASALGPLVDDDGRLAAMAVAAWTVGRPDAARDAAALVAAAAGLDLRCGPEVHGDGR